MSNIGKIPIEIKDGVQVTIAGPAVSLKGPKGELSFNADPQIEIKQEEKNIVLKEKGKTKTSKALFGLTRSIVANMMQGVTEGFEKQLKVVGVGYKVAVAGDKLTLEVGYSHPIEIKAPAGIQFAVEKNIIKVSGCDKGIVGEIAARIRKVRTPEPYKGKGIMYVDEHIRRKAGKAAKTGAAAGAGA